MVNPINGIQGKVDGVIIANEVIDNVNSQTQDFGNDLKNLNADDFESMSVLKGAAATALYGSWAANRVILITTQKGKKGSGIGVSLSHSETWDVVYKTPDVQNEFGMGTQPAWALNFDGKDYPFYKFDSEYLRNNALKPEKQYALEFGLEAKLLQINKLTPENIARYNAEQTDLDKYIPEDFTRWEGGTVSNDFKSTDKRYICRSIKADGTDMRAANKPQTRLWKDFLPILSEEEDAWRHKNAPKHSLPFV